MPGDTKTHLARQEEALTVPQAWHCQTANEWFAACDYALESPLDAAATADEVDTAELCKLTHALSQRTATYLKAVEIGELKA